MKTLLQITILLLLNYAASAQECTFSDNFMGQATIDNFAQNYPGCKVLNANFETSAEVENLQGLDQLEAVKGSIEIKCKARNLNGLQNLEYITRTLSISENSELEELTALAKQKRL